MRDEGSDRKRTSRAIWGVSLIALGTVFLLERLGTIDWGGVEHLWPVVFYVIAAAHLGDRRFGSAACFALIGTWLLACSYHWYGFTHSNSWPAILVAVGICWVIESLTGEERHRGKARNAS